MIFGKCNDNKIIITKFLTQKKRRRKVFEVTPTGIKDM